MTKSSTLAAVLAFSTGVLGHPSTPEGIRAALETRSRVTSHSARALERCATDPKALALRNRAVARRAAKAKALRAKRGLNSGTNEPCLKPSAQWDRRFLCRLP